METVAILNIAEALSRELGMSFYRTVARYALRRDWEQLAQWLDEQTEWRIHSEFIKLQALTNAMIAKEKVR